MQFVQFHSLQVSRLILGSNPFSGFSHQGQDVDLAMKRYFTTATIKRTLHEAEGAGVNTLIARTDYHVMRLLLEYWDEGGRLQWFAQTCPEVGSHEACVSRAASGGAKACHIHGGVMDHLFAQGRLDEIPAVVKTIRGHGMLAGVAAHNPDVLRWVEAHADVDYYMCSYYNPIPRVRNAEHVAGTDEQYLEADRDAMTALIPTLSRPAIHYKVLAAGRNDPAAAFARVAACLRPSDAVCVGVFPKDHRDMIREDAALLEAALGVPSLAR